jgi:hypothetical protein
MLNRNQAIFFGSRATGLIQVTFREFYCKHKREKNQTGLKNTIDTLHQAIFSGSRITDKCFIYFWNGFNQATTVLLLKLLSNIFSYYFLYFKPKRISSYFFPGAV